MAFWRGLFRWRAIVPLALFLAALLAGWLLFLDTLVRRGVEEAGSRIVGAKVDVAAAAVRLEEGYVELRGIQVANPDAPMTNLVEAERVVADLLVGPLLAKKIVIETLAVRGVRFGTPRTTSGALDRRSPTSGRVYREVADWAGRVRIPPLSLEGLRTVIDVSAISPDSLRTLQLARAARTRADSLERAVTQRLAALDPAPRLDSAQALARQLREANPLRLGLAGVTRLAGAARTTLASLDELRDNLASLDGDVTRALRGLAANVLEFAAARQADYAYARGLLNVPSLSAPELSPALFGQAAVDWVRPVLYWMRMAEEYLPPGLRPSRFSGPRRVRRAGTTVRFPRPGEHPKFLLARGEVDLSLGGEGAAAGRYTARISDLTSDPALLGRPLTMFAERTGAARGPQRLSLAAVLDHAGRPLRDSVAVLVQGIALPTLTLNAIGARLALGEGATDLSLRRVGDALSARWVWRSNRVTWERLGGQAEGQADATGRPTQAAELSAWAQDLLWRVVSSLREVEIEVGLGGTVTQPTLAVRSNVGDALAAGLRRELGREIEEAERRVRAEVDGLIEPRVREARAAVEGVRSDVAPRVAAELQRVREVEQELRRELERLTGGVRIP